MPLILELLHWNKMQSREYSLFHCPVSVILYRTYILYLYLYIKQVGLLWCSVSCHHAKKYCSEVGSSVYVASVSTHLPYHTMYNPEYQNILVQTTLFRQLVSMR
jgi:hypothetical protein